MTVTQLEKRIVWIALVFVLLLLVSPRWRSNVSCRPAYLPDEREAVSERRIDRTFADTLRVHYVARMWRFEPEEVTVPAGSTVDIYLSTADVTHGLILLGTDLNLMAVPGVVNYARVKFDKPRVYQVLCHEYCGTGHDRMAANFHVVDAATFHRRQPRLRRQVPTDPGYKLLEARNA